MSASPPKATEWLRHRELSRRAILGLMHCKIFCHRSPPVALTLPETLEEGGESGDAPILALPERAPQFTLENLTRAGHRQRIRAHIDAMGAFVPGNPFLTEVDEIDCLNCRPRFHGDYCMDRFPPTCVRNA